MNEISDVKFENERIGRRLRAAVEARSTIKAAAQIAEVTEKTLRRWMNGESSIDVGAVIRICRALAINPLHVLAGIDGESGDWETHLPALSIGEKRVPVHDVAAAAGYGIDALDEAPRSWFTFPLEWLMSLGDPDALGIIRVEGDSMVPELRDGDQVMIDRNQRQLKDGLFVVSVDDRLFLKRVRVLGRNRIELVSANPAYPAFEIVVPDEQDDVAQDGAIIVGKVVWSGRAH